MMLLVKAIYNAIIGTGAVRSGVLPTSADGAAAAAITLTKNAVAWTWGAWAQIVAAAGLTVDTWLVGLTLENLSNPVSTIQGEVQVGTGGAGAEAAIGTYPISASVLFLPSRIRIPNGTRIAARFRSSSATADTVDVKLLTQTGVSQ